MIDLDVRHPEICAFCGKECINYFCDLTCALEFDKLLKKRRDDRKALKKLKN